RNDQEGGDPSLRFQAPAAGDYFVGVSAAGNAGDDPAVANSGTAGGARGGDKRGVGRGRGGGRKGDLNGGSVRLGAERAAWGETVSVAFRVENRGGTDSRAFVVRLLLSPDNRFGDNAVVLQTVERPGGLEAGGAFSSQVTVMLPARPQGFAET